MIGIVLFLITLINLFITIFIIYFVSKTHSENIDTSKNVDTSENVETFGSTSKNVDRKLQKSLMEFYNDDIQKNYLLAKFPMYFINLDPSTARRDYIHNEFSKYGLPIPTRISAIPGKHLPDLKKGQIKDISYQVECKEPYKYEELGCTLSHLLAILQAMNDGHDMAIIFEDDVSLELMNYWDPDLNILLDRANKENEKWEIIHLSAMNFYVPDQQFYFKKRYPSYIAYATAYLIHRRGMNSILSRFMRKKKFFYIDDTPFADDLLYRHAVTLIPNRVYFIPYNDKNELDSTIHTDHTNTHLDLSFHISKNMLKNKIINYPTNRTIHQIWFTFDHRSKQRFEKMKPLRDTCIQVNNNWRFILWNEEKCLELIHTHLPWFLDRYTSYPHKVCQIDAMKYILSYLFGGIAMDMDIICLKNMDTLVQNHDLVFVEQWKDMVANDFIYSSKPNNPLLGFIISDLITVKSNHILDLTGPEYLQKRLSSLKPSFSDMFHIVPYKLTHPFVWDRYENKCHIKNKDFNVDNCIDKYKDTEVVFLTVYTASWH